MTTNASVCANDNMCLLAIVPILKSLSQSGFNPQQLSNNNGFDVNEDTVSKHLDEVVQITKIGIGEYIYIYIHI